MANRIPTGRAQSFAADPRKTMCEIHAGEAYGPLAGTDAQKRDPPFAATGYRRQQPWRATRVRSCQETLTGMAPGETANG